MRQGSNGRRGRGRGSGRKPQNNRNQSFDSNGPSGRIRGTATQLHEKYLSLARDATASGDRITAENCFQHADHYYRIVLVNQAPAEPYVDDIADFDGDDTGSRQNSREQHARDGNGRDHGQRRRMNGNGHDVDGNHDDDVARNGGGERRARREADDRDRTDAGPDENAPDVAAKDEGAPSSGRRNAKRGDAADERPRERRRSRKPSATAESGDEGDDAELRRALGGAGIADEVSAEAPAEETNAGADEAPEKPRRRRPPSSRVND